MAGFTNVAEFLAPAIQGLNVLGSGGRFAENMAGQSSAEYQRNQLRAQQDMALQQLQQMQDMQMRETMADAEARRRDIALDAQTAEETRRAALKRAVARQRAAFGASGIDTTGGGSAQAVLLGLFDESDAERAQRERLDSFRLGAIDQDVDYQAQRNVLERTHLAQQYQLQQSLVGYGKEKKTVLGRFFDSIR